MTVFSLNGKKVTVDVRPDTPLLWVLRDHLQLNGTKYGCGAGLCGACSVIVDGDSVRSCVSTVAAIEGKSVITIEGLGGDHPVQQAWIQLDVPQCGYCQSGQIMSTVALLENTSDLSNGLTDDDIKTALAGNICRCGAYLQIIDAVHLSVELKNGLKPKELDSAQADAEPLYYPADAASMNPGGDAL